MEVTQFVPGEESATPTSSALATVATYANLLEPEPSGDGIQEVVFQLPTGPMLRFSVDTSAADLAGRVAEMADTAFVTAGENGLAALTFAFAGHRDDPQLRGDPPDRFGATTPRRRLLVQSLDAYWLRQRDRIAATQDDIVKTVTAAANKRLDANSAALAADSQRYLGTARPYLNGHDSLNGPDAKALVADLREIAAAAHGPLRAAERVLSVRWQTALQQSQWWFDPGPVGAPTSPNIDMLAQLPEVVDAQKDVDDRRAEFAVLVTRLGGTQPILFRLALSDVLERLDDSSVVAAAVAVALDDARGAGEKLRDLLSDPSKCWLFGPLVNSALRDAGVGSETFAMRVAQDRLAEANGQSGFGEAATLLGQFALIGAAVEGPVEGVLVIASLILDTVEVFVQALKAHDRQLGFDAFLDPSLSFDVDQSWDAVLLAAFFVFVGVATSGSSVRTLVRR